MKMSAAGLRRLLILAGPGVFMLCYYLTESYGWSLAAAAFTLTLTAARLVWQHNRRIQAIRGSDIESIDAMDNKNFIEYLEQLYRSQGYTVQRVGQAGYGADLILRKAGTSIVLQAKRYSRKVGVSAVQQVHAAVNHYRADEAWVVANQDYTDQALQLASSNNVKLINRDQLIAMMVKWKEASNKSAL